MRNQSSTIKTLAGLAPFILTMVFVMSSVDKLLHFDQFISAVDGYYMVPAAAARPIAGSILSLEMVLAAGLIWPGTRRTASVVSACALLVFATALALSRHFNPDVECGCLFTITLRQSTGLHIAQNVLLAGLGVSQRFDERTTLLAVTPAT